MGIVLKLITNSATSVGFMDLLSLRALLRVIRILENGLRIFECQDDNIEYFLIYVSLLELVLFLTQLLKEMCNYVEFKLSNTFGIFFHFLANKVLVKL